MYNLEADVNITGQLSDLEKTLNLTYTIEGLPHMPEVKLTTEQGLVCTRIIKSGSYYIATGYMLDGSSNKLTPIDMVGRTLVELVQMINLIETEDFTKENVMSNVTRGNKGYYVDWFNERTERIRQEQEAELREQQKMEALIAKRLQVVETVFKGYSEIKHTVGFIKPPTPNAGSIPYRALQGVGITVKYYVEAGTLLAIEVLNAFNGKARAYTFDLLLEEATLTQRLERCVKDVLRM